VNQPAWRLRVLPPARRQLDSLPESAAGAVLETLQAIRDNPHRLGKPLTLGLAGRFSARRGPYRVIYEIDETERLVRVLAIGHRRDIYRR
jgi:mRNA interferase RelE/StbE